MSATVTLVKSTDYAPQGAPTAPREFVNYPTLVKGESHVSGVSLDKIDYSDGYGHEYAPGE